MTATLVPLRGHRGRSGRRWLRGGLVVIAVIVLGSTISAGALAQQSADVPDDAEIVNELVQLEDRLGGIALMATVSVSDEETWATIRGEFVGPRVRLEEIDADLAGLVGRTTRSDTRVADAVGAVAAGYRTQLEGFRHMEAYEEAALAVVVDDDLTTDDARGHAEVGLRLLLEALAGFDDGYAVLRDADAATEHRELFEARFAAVEDAARGDAHDARIALSAPASEALVPVSRFEPETAGADPAQSVRYTCVDREAWLVERPDEPVPSLPVPEGEQAQLPFPDCPDLDEEHGAVIVPPG